MGDDTVEVSAFGYASCTFEVSEEKWENMTEDEREQFVSRKFSSDASPNEMDNYKVY